MPVVRGHNRAGRARFGSQQFESGQDESLPPVASARQLINAWAARDARYAHRKVMGIHAPLSDKEQVAVITYRRREADDLPIRDRAVALTKLSQWNAPKVMA